MSFFFLFRRSKEIKEVRNELTIWRPKSYRHSVTDYTLADDVGVIGGVSSLVGDSLGSGRRCSWTDASLENNKIHGTVKKNFYHKTLELL